MNNSKLIALLPDLASFILVVEHGSFTLAAKQLDVTPSALSKLITRLEKALGSQLLERTTRKIHVTPAGEQVYTQACVMLNAAQQAVESAQDDHSLTKGIVTAAAPEAFLNSVLQPLVPDFLERYPDIELRLRVVDSQIDLFNTDIDVAFNLTDQPYEHLVSREICKSDLVLCASASYVEANGTPQHPTDLVSHQCLYLAEHEKDNVWSFSNGHENHSIAVKGRYAVNHSQMRLNGVKQGLGIGIFHDFVVKEDMKSGTLIPVLSDWKIKSNYHGAIAMQYAQTQYQPARIRAFIEFAHDRLTSLLDSTGI